MTLPGDSLDAARRRIQAAYDPGLVKMAGRTLADLLAENLRKVQASESVVLNWADPRTSVAEAARFVDSQLPPAIDERDRNRRPSNENISLDALTRRFGELVEVSLARGINLHDPRYVG